MEFGLCVFVVDSKRHNREKCPGHPSLSKREEFETLIDLCHLVCRGAPSVGSDSRGTSFRLVFLIFIRKYCIEGENGRIRILTKTQS